MTTIALVIVGSDVVRVECDGLARDNLLPTNVILVGCRELDTEARDGDALDTRMWSLPASSVLSYAVGNLQAKIEPTLETAAPVEALPPTVLDLTEEQKANRRARYDRMDDAIRAPRVERAKAKTKARKPSKKD